MANVQIRNAACKERGSSAARQSELKTDSSPDGASGGNTTSGKPVGTPGEATNQAIHFAGLIGYWPFYDETTPTHRHVWRTPQD